MERCFSAASLRPAACFEVTSLAAAAFPAVVADVDAAAEASVGRDLPTSAHPLLGFREVTAALTEDKDAGRKHNELS